MKLGQAVILDFETLDFLGTSVVVSMGVLALDFKQREGWNFDFLRTQGLNIKFKIGEQIKDFGRTTSPGTLAWWKKQPAAVQKVLQPSSRDVSILQLDDILTKYVSDCGVDFRNAILFARGGMDWSIVDDIYSKNLNKGDVRPYAFWNTRCTRSFIHFVADSPRGRIDLPKDWMPADAVVHDALDDCVLDALRIHYILNELGE